MSPVSQSLTVLFLVEQTQQMTCSNAIQELVPKPFGSRGFHKYSEIILQHVLRSNGEVVIEDLNKGFDVYLISYTCS